MSAIGPPLPSSDESGRSECRRRLFSGTEEERVPMPIHIHRIFKHLKRDDVFTEEQADRIAEALSEMDIAGATKEDLDATEKRLDGRIDDLDNRLMRSKIV
jgi:hypothetical protein